MEKSRFPEFLDEMLVSMDYIEGASEENRDKDWEHNSYTCTLRFDGKKYTVAYYQGIGIKEPPSKEYVVAALLLDSRCGGQSFEEFCSEFGYDTDSRKHHKTWKACVVTNAKLHRFLGTYYDKFEEAAQDF
jgi:hypothetical protein